MNVLAPGMGEIIGGSQREERLEVLDRSMGEHGIDKEHYAWCRDLPCYGLAHLVAGRHEEALKLADRARHEQPRSGTSMDIAATACGHLDGSRKGANGSSTFANCGLMEPGAFKRSRGRIASPEVGAIFVEGFRRAGLPEV